MDEERLETAEGGGSPESGGFMDGWEEAEAGEPEQGREEPEPGGAEAEQAGEQEQAGQAGGAEPQQPRTWQLNGTDGTPVTVGEAEMAELARKGLAYDRLEAEQAEIRPGVELLSAFAKEAGVSLAEYVKDLRIRLKQAEGLDEDEARRTVELEARETAMAAKAARERAAAEAAAKQAEQKQSWEARRDADIQTFMQVFPEAAGNPAAIPPEVWEAVRGGASLTVAYAKHARETAAAQADREAKARAQAAENASRSAGSMRSAGSDAVGKDPFLEGWEDS